MNAYEMIVIDPRDILEPLGMMQYMDCFLTNLQQKSSNKYEQQQQPRISIGKLKQLKIHHLTQMNIRDFQDQTEIMERIRTLLLDLEEEKGKRRLMDMMDIATEGNSAIPLLKRDESTVGELVSMKKETSRCLRLDECIMAGSDNKLKCLARNSRCQRNSWSSAISDTNVSCGTSSSISSRPRTERLSRNSTENFQEHHRVGEDNNGIKTLQSSSRSQKGVSAKRRRSSVALMKEVEDNLNLDQQVVRRMSARAERRQSRTISDTTCGMLFTQSRNEKERAQSLKDKAIDYGESAARSALSELSLVKLVSKILNTFGSSIACERSNILFIDFDKVDEMFFYEKSQKISFVSKRSIAGFVAKYGGVVNVKDAYSDDRFNPEVDKRTGFKTECILCAPIRSRSDNRTVAVIQMLNKKEGKCFTHDDENIIDTCAVLVADALARQTEIFANTKLKK